MNLHKKMDEFEIKEKQQNLDIDFGGTEYEDQYGDDGNLDVPDIQGD